jgi:hypothetical protein
VIVSKDGVQEQTTKQLVKPAVLEVRVAVNRGWSMELRKKKQYRHNGSKEEIRFHFIWLPLWSGGALLKFVG